MVELQQGQTKFCFQTGDSKGGIVELDLLFVAAGRRVIARDDLDRAVFDPAQDRLPVAGGPQRRVHFESRVIDWPGRRIPARAEMLEESGAIALPEWLAPGHGHV